MATPLLQIEGLTKSVGDRMLFEGVNLTLNEGDKVGLIAKNGTGKTTLLRIVAGQESADSGRLIARRDLRTGYLAQTPELRGGVTAAEECRRLALEAGARGEDLSERVVRQLTQLGLEDSNAMTETLSGGQRKRVALAAIILSEPELVILDEPTNHLDIETVEWLEKWLSRSRTTLLMVTHDRYFLDRVTRRIVELDQCRAYAYEGNFDYYLRRREERIAAQEAESLRLANTLRREQEWMNRQPQARAGKAKYRIDAFYEMSDRKRELQRRDDNVKLGVKASYIGSKIFEARGVSKSYGEKKILRDFSYTFARYEKVGIVGKNGIGKSTLIKILQGIVEPDGGEIEVGETVRFGYYSQDGIRFDERKKVIDAITEWAEEVHLDDKGSLTPMQFLNHFLFSPADQQKYISTLSGGERARLYLAAVLMLRPNFLILDEPTNDLDIVTLSILEEYLREFKGCLIVVSHDRYFLDSIVDHLFVMEGDGVVRDFPGNYSEYRDKALEGSKEKEATPQATAKSKPRHNDKRRKTYAERKEYERLGEEIATLEEEKLTLEALFASGALGEDIVVQSSRYEEVKTLLDEKELRWLELDEIEG